MNFLQPQCSDEDCCGNGIDGSSCTPQAWANACSIGWYLTDRCELDILFRIKKDGVVVVGPSTAHSYSMTPDNGEVAHYAVEYCFGPEPCTWIVVWEADVDTTTEDACPMGIYGQTYVVGLRQSDNTVVPSGTYIYCQSSLVVRVSAACFAFGQKITHLWIDDTLWTPNTSSAGGIATESFDEPLSYSFMCHSGRDYAHTDTYWNDTTLPQIRIPLPIAFAKNTCSVRARQTNGVIIGCTVEFTCTAHYNAASVTLPSWDGMSLACEANGGPPFGWAADPTGGGLKTWCQHFETSLEITPTESTGGTFSWITCQSAYSSPLVVGRFSFVYNFKCNGLLKWIDSRDTPPRPVYSGTYSFDHTVEFDIELRLGAVYSPGSLSPVGLGINAEITSPAVSTITGHNDYPIDLIIANLHVDWLTVLNGTFDPNRFFDSGWFDAVLFDGLGCGPPPYDGDAFQWKWTGPQLPVIFWTVVPMSDDGDGGPLGGDIPYVPSPIINSGSLLGGSYTNAVWPADTMSAIEWNLGAFSTRSLVIPVRSSTTLGIGTPGLIR